MKNIRSYITTQNQKVTGKVVIQLYKWNIQIHNVSSDFSLFDENLVTFNKNVSFNQNSSAGFIELYNLPQKLAYNVTK